MSFKEKVVWVSLVSEAYNSGKPELAWDQAGDLLDLLQDAFAVIEEHGLDAEFEERVATGERSR